MIAARRDPRSRLTADYDVLYATSRREICVAVAAVRPEHGIARHQGEFQCGAFTVRQTFEMAGTATVCDSENGELPLREASHRLQPLRREVLPPGAGRRCDLLRICEGPDPFARTLTRFSLEGLIRLHDPGEAHCRAAADDGKHQHPPAPDRVFVESQPPREFADRPRCGSAQHIPQRDHEQVRAMEPADGTTRSARIGLLAASAAVALNFGPGAAPLVPALVATEGALVILVCPCFDLRDRLRLSPEIPDLRLSALDLGRVQLVEVIEEAAEIMM